MGMLIGVKSVSQSNAAQKYKSSQTERDRKIGNRLNFRIKNQELLKEYLLQHPCIDCGNSDFRVLDFDHRDVETKMFDVSGMLYSHSWKNILIEIDKCDVRCANCHRIRTATQFGYWRSK